jgi:Tol biopolymer transport system component
METFSKSFLTAVFIFAATLVSEAQFRANQFGKNRVQYKKMEWRFVSTPNFDIFFYDGGYDVAKLAAEFAEQDFSRITELVGFSPYNKTKVLIYNSVIDLQQSNIGVYYQSYSKGGQTNFIRSEVEIAFTGSKADFKRELASGIADVLIFEMMYGGSLKDIFQNSFLLNLPEWFMSGAASYISNGWDIKMDDYVRDAVRRNKTKKIQNLEGEDARLIGQSVWNYIAEEYGRSNIANVLNLTRIVRNEEQSIQQTLGVSFKTFIKGWRAYYEKQYQDLAESHITPQPEQAIDPSRKKLVYNQVKVSPNGKFMAYSYNLRGRYKVKVKDLDKGKSKTVLKGGYKLLNQKVDNEMPLLAWRDQKELGIFAPKNGNMLFYFYDVNKKKSKRDKRIFKSFSNIKAFDISTDGNYLALSAEWRGKSDLYYYDYRQRKLTQLTNDAFDDLSPRFIPGNERMIAFSSNRLKDSLEVLREVPATDITDNFNIFVYDFNNPEALRRVTNTLSKDWKPEPLNRNEILYLSDQRGISQLYHYNLKDSIASQVTNFTTSIKEYDFHRNSLYMVMFSNGAESMFKIDNIDYNSSNFTTKTLRQQVFDLRYLQILKRKRQEEERIRKIEEDRLRREQEEARLREAIRRSALAYQDSLPAEEQFVLTVDSLQRIAELNPLLADSLINMGVKIDSTSLKTGGVAQQANPGEVDTDNYQFDTLSKGKRKSFLERYRSKLNEQNEDDRVVKISRSAPYERMFAADNIVFTPLIDPLRNWGFLFELAMTDVLENHKINMGVFLVANLGNSNLFAEYEYLRSRLDYRARYERRNLEINAENFNQLYSMNIFQGSVSYPFNITSRLSFEPFFVSTRYTNTDRSRLTIPDELINYAGFNTEFIYDNSIITGVNMIQGTRLKVKYENYTGLGEAGSNKSFGMFMFDIRHYQKVHKSIVFATRLSYGQFMGKDKKEFLLGGMDNWLGNRNRINTSGDDNPLNLLASNNNSDLLFHQFITPLRGFEWNALYGNNFMLFNAELRFPLLKYFYKGTITSNFFRNLQLVGFTDVGSAWTGLSPFNRENALNTENITRVDQDGFGWRARVQNFKNPFLMGYGAGIRTMLTGIYTKLDVAWGVEDKLIRKPRYYLTFGYDF